MSRLSSFAAVLLLGAAPFAAADGRSASPAEIKAAAKAQVALGCKAAPKSCGELTEIEAGYLAELSRLEPCRVKGGCTADLVLSSFRAAELLDAREELLPREARAAGVERPLLRLSLLLSKDATFAYAAVSLQGTIETWQSVGSFASKDVDAACALLGESQACRDARESLSDAQLLVGLAQACVKLPKKCDFSTLENGAQISEESWRAYQHASADAKVQLATLFALIKEGQDRFSLIVAADMKRRQQELAAGISDLSSRVDAVAGGGGDAAQAAARFNALSDTYRQASIDADRLTSYGYVEGFDGPSFRDDVNASATRLAELRSRLALASAGELAKGLAPSAGPGGLPPAAAGQQLQGASAVPGLSAADPTLLDRRLIPPPPPEHPSAPPILADKPGVLAILRNLGSDDPLARADARRRMGLSYTVGDPSGRAALVHSQQFSDDCAIVTQQEVLLAHGLVSNADPVMTEKILASEARLRGFIGMGGTPAAYSGDLLVDRRLLVDKRSGAPLEELDAAVREGGLVIAAVDARYLWNRAGPSALGHSILVTGAEIDKKTHETVGYYINDSGKNPPGRGVFVPIAAFRKAWDGYSRNYAEVR